MTTVQNPPLNNEENTERDVPRLNQTCYEKCMLCFKFMWSQNTIRSMIYVFLFCSALLTIAGIISLAAFQSFALSLCQLLWIISNLFALIVFIWSVFSFITLIKNNQWTLLDKIKKDGFFYLIMWSINYMLSSVLMLTYLTDTENHKIWFTTPEHFTINFFNTNFVALSWFMSIFPAVICSMPQLLFVKVVYYIYQWLKVKYEEYKVFSSTVNTVDPINEQPSESTNSNNNI